MTKTQSISAATTLDSSPKFSAEMWAAFWAAPTMSRGMDILADDVVGYWPGDPEPVRGVEPYTKKIAELLAAAPDLRLELVDSATVPGAADGEQLIFLHYVGHGTGPDGPFEMARPLNTAPDDAGTVTSAAVGPRQALIVPSSLSKMKFDVPSVAGLAVVPTWNWPAMPENTAPVGSPGTPCAGRPPMSTRTPAPV